MGEPLRFAVHGAGADGNLTLRNAGAHLPPASSPGSDHVRSPINTRSSPLRQQRATALPSLLATPWKTCCKSELQLMQQKHAKQICNIGPRTIPPQKPFRGWIYHHSLIQLQCRNRTLCKFALGRKPGFRSGAEFREPFVQAE
jgi:hypothetical protein